MVANYAEVSGRPTTGYSRWSFHGDQNRGSVKDSFARAASEVVTETPILKDRRIAQTPDGKTILVKSEGDSVSIGSILGQGLLGGSSGAYGAGLLGMLIGNVVRFVGDAIKGKEVVKSLPGGGGEPVLNNGLPIPDGVETPKVHTNV